MPNSHRAPLGLVWIERLVQDLRYGFRMLAASPGFAVIAILSLAIGIGANTAIFSFADALLLRPLPVARPGEIYTVGSTASIEAFNASSLVSSYRDYVDIRDRAKSFDGLTAFTEVRAGFAADPAAVPKLKLVMLATGNLFTVMGVEPVLGRGFRSDEDQVPGRDAVVVLGHALWENEFSSDPSVIGRVVRLDGTPFTIIGVAPAEFTSLDQYVRVDFFVPLMMSARLINDPKAASLEARDARDLDVKGRLKPGVSQASAQAELTAIGTDLERAYPDTNKNRRFAIRTELQARMAQDPPDATLIAMLGTLALAVLFVACANVAGLLTSRAPARAREMALRLAIGAGRGRLVRQLVTESLLIALAGGLLGLVVGYAGMTLFRQIEIPTDLSITIGFRLDRRALVFSFLVATASALLFGLLPAIQAARTDLTSVMKAGDAVAPGRLRRRWGRAVLVGGQVAVSVVLLVVALFMYRGFGQQLVAGPGYRTDHLLLMTIDPRLVRYTDDQAKQFFQEIGDRARRAPGVAQVAMASTVPMQGDSLGADSIEPEGYQFPVGKDHATVISARVDEHYFETLRLTLVSGRGFQRTDTADAPKVVIVNEQLAQHYWPNQEAVGKRIRLEDKSWAQVVGVAKTSKYVFIAEPPTEFLYFPYRQKNIQSLVLIVQSAADPTTLVGPMREIVHGLDANMPIYNVRTMSEFYQMRAVSIFNVLVTTVGSMGVMGLSLAIIGLYGLVAFAVSRRTREIGIRMAIGADRSLVLRMVLRQGLTLAVVGLVVGLAASVGAGELLRAAFPMANNQRDVMALVLVVPVVLAATALAVYIPARRAAGVNPMQALRYE